MSILRGMRIRKKLILLHTGFSITLALVLFLAERPAIRDVVAQSEEVSCTLAVRLLAVDPASQSLSSLRETITTNTGPAAALDLPPELASRARASANDVVIGKTAAGWPRAVMWDADREEFFEASVRASAARAAVLRLYLLVVAAVVGVYFLIAATLEVFVLPRQVYGPIRRLLAADLAVQSGDRDHELIPEAAIPADELGEIMRSRNESIMNIREHERALAEALDQLEDVAMDLKRKNHLLETAKRNMADQDRLVSLGLLSAGLAHELNTPLAVLKGSVERLAENPGAGVDPAQAALMQRVVHRLERLSESLLDFARVRPPEQSPVDLRTIIEEAWTLVRIDREARDVELVNEVPSGAEVIGDEDRLTQVFVNLLRNAADAMNGDGKIVIAAEHEHRDECEWVTIRCADDGPGIDPDVLPRLFEPFTSTRLDAHGTGLGLAVAEGIVREHGGVLLARNAPTGGAVFEVMLPVQGAALEHLDETISKTGAAIKT